MRLILELLDAEVVDGNKVPLGKVDGIVLEVRERGRPRVTAIQIGAPVLARRLHNPVRGLIEWFARKWDATTMTIPWQRVHEVGIDVEVHLEGDVPESRAWERWLAHNIVARIPGG